MWAKKIKLHTFQIFDAEGLSGQASRLCRFSQLTSEETALDICWFLQSVLQPLLDAPTQGKNSISEKNYTAAARCPEFLIFARTQRPFMIKMRHSNFKLHTKLRVYNSSGVWVARGLWQRVLLYCFIFGLSVVVIHSVTYYHSTVSCNDRS